MVIFKDFLRYLNFKLGLSYVDNWFVFSPVSKNFEQIFKRYVNLKIIDIFQDSKSSNYSYSQDQSIIMILFIPLH